MSLSGMFQVVLSGLGSGATYALIGLSFALIFGRLKICSYLNGDLAILAAYGMFWGFNLLGFDPFISAAILIPVFFFIGYYIQDLMLKPFMAMEVWQGRYQAQVMVTWGTGMAIMGLEYVFWSGTYRMLNVAYRNTTVDILSAKLTLVNLLALLAIVVIFVVLQLLLKRTALGISLRACSDDRVSAMLTGINYRRVCAVTFGISSAIAVLGGLFYILGNQITPAIGVGLTFKGWLAVIIGGRGSLGGTIAAGLTIGLVESIVSYLWIPALKEVVLFIGLLLLLIFRPERDD